MTLESDDRTRTPSFQALIDNATTLKSWNEGREISSWSQAAAPVSCSSIRIRSRQSGSDVVMQDQRSSVVHPSGVVGVDLD